MFNWRRPNFQIYSSSLFDIGSSTLVQHRKQQSVRPNLKTRPSLNNNRFNTRTLSNSICSCTVQILTLDFNKPEKWISKRNHPLSKCTSIVQWCTSQISFTSTLMSICRMSALVWNYCTHAVITRGLYTFYPLFS